MVAVIFTTLLLTEFESRAQNLPDSCKLLIGTNLGGLSDWGTELPFVNLMHNCREWYTKDVNNPNAPWNSETVKYLKFRTDGYPTHIPQTITERQFPQKVATIWAITDGWEPGVYTVLFDGTGKLSFWGGLSNLKKVLANKYTFEMKNPVGSQLEMIIDESAQSDPVRNIRVLMPGSEAVYLEKPFNPVWIEKLKVFKSVRFMDWGATNNWGQPDPWTWTDTTRFNWSDRQTPEYYTWATNKGIPYEMMVKLMNDYDLDGWVCVPHRAGNDYISSMARLFHQNLEPGRKLTVEYSNEIWNWMFGQTQWLNKYGCVEKGKPWPEGIVPYIQNCMDLWTAEYGANKDRIVRAVGVQTAWGDVSRRITLNMRKGSFDAVSPTYYFGLSEEGDKALDVLGASAKVSDVAYWVRKSRETNEKRWILEIKKTIADVSKLPLVFYEGGQHITPQPFGEEPTYAQALLDIQRDTTMYNLYNEWFTWLRTLQSGSKPMSLMNFSFVGQRSARYGSWGILETMNQDINKIPAPKYKSVMENIHSGCFEITAIEQVENAPVIECYPNPVCEVLHVRLVGHEKIQSVKLFDASGRLLLKVQPETGETQIDVSKLKSGFYLVSVVKQNNKTETFRLVRN